MLCRVVSVKRRNIKIYKSIQEYIYRSIIIKIARKDIKASKHNITYSKIYNEFIAISTSTGILVCTKSKNQIVILCHTIPEIKRIENLINLFLFFQFIYLLFYDDNDDY